MSRRVLPEIAQPIEVARTTATPFPDKCPNCGAERTEMLNAVDVVDYKREAKYACGAAYTNKPQIQNHTEKWWGICPLGEDTLV